MLNFFKVNLSKVCKVKEVKNAKKSCPPIKTLPFPVSKDCFERTPKPICAPPPKVCPPTPKITCKPTTPPPVCKTPTVPNNPCLPPFPVCKDPLPPVKLPDCKEPELPTCKELEPPSPKCETSKVNGSAGLFGDPQFGIFTPDVDVPDSLKGFESGLQNGQTVTVLQDSDNDGFKVDVTGVQVDPNNPNTVGVGVITFTAGNQTITVRNGGTVMLTNADGSQQNLGVMDSNFMPVTLNNGTTLSVNQEIDNASGGTTARFVVNNGEYKVTAALRSPHPDSRSYFDMNFEELTNNAADNASGYQSPFNGLGIVDLLKMEPTN